MRLKVFISAFFFFASPVIAQQVWVPHASTPDLTLEIVSSDVTNVDAAPCSYSGLLSKNYYLGARYPLRDGMLLMAEVPFGSYDMEGPIGADVIPSSFSDTRIGNPLIGAVYSLPERTVHIAFAFRLPVTSLFEHSQEAGHCFALGRYSDFERKDAFSRGDMPFMLSLVYTPHFDFTRHKLALRGGVKSVWGTATNQRWRQSQYIAAIADLDFEPVTVRIGALRYFLEFDTRLQDLLGASASLRLGRFSPGIGVRHIVGDLIGTYARTTMNFNISYSLAD